MDIVYTLVGINNAAKELWQAGKQNKIWALHGEMGAGKTTFVHALCEYLEVKDVISSPTFSIINEYQSAIAGTIYHMDWYRLKDEEEALQAGIEDCLLSGNFCIVEWPEKAAGLLPEGVLNIYIETLDAATRKIQI